MTKTAHHINVTLSEIRSGKTSRDKVIKHLYHDQALRGSIQSMLSKKGGKREDFDMVFNTALMQFIKTVVKNAEMNISSTLNSYITGIAKYVWYAELSKRKKHQVEPIENYFDIAGDTTPESLVINFSQKELVHELLQNLGKNCKEVLLYWANGYKMQEIAKLLNYKSEGMAKKKKHICFKELLTYLGNNPHIKKILQ